MVTAMETTRETSEFGELTAPELDVVAGGTRSPGANRTAVLKKQLAEALDRLSDIQSQVQ
jgi:hypothetical protein